MNNLWDQKKEFTAYRKNEQFDFVIIYPENENNGLIEMYYFNNNNQVMERTNGLQISNEFEDKFNKLNEEFEFFTILYGLEQDYLTEFDDITIKCTYDGYVDSPTWSESERVRLLSSRLPFPPE